MDGGEVVGVGSMNLMRKCWGFFMIGVRLVCNLVVFDGLWFFGLGDFKFEMEIYFGIFLFRLFLWYWSWWVGYCCVFCVCYGCEVFGKEGEKWLLKDYIGRLVKVLLVDDISWEGC